MFKERLVAFSLIAARAGEIKKFKDFLDASVHLGGCLSATAILDGARPAALHSHAVITVQAVAAGAL